MHSIAFYSFLAAVVIWPLCFPKPYCYIAIVPTIILLLYTWKNGPFGGYIFRTTSPLLFLWFDPTDDELRRQSMKELDLLTQSLVNTGRNLLPPEDEDLAVGDGHEEECDELSMFFFELGLEKYLSLFRQQKLSFEMLPKLDYDDYQEIGSPFS